MTRKSITKKELIKHLESTLLDSGITIETCKQFNLYKWLAIVLVSSCISLCSCLIFFVVIDTLINVEIGLGVFSFTFLFLLHGVITGIIIKYQECIFNYYPK